MSDQTSGTKLVNNEILTLVSRFVMIVGVPVALGVGGWMLNRGVETADKIGQKIDLMKDQAFDTNTTVKLIQQAQGEQSRIVADHEARMRAVESLTRTLRN